MKRMNMAALVAVATVLAHPFRTLAAAASTKPEPKLRLTAPTLPAMPRAIAGTVRADGSDPATLIRALNGAFDEFKTTHAREIEEIKAGKTDVLTKDKLDAINATLTELQTAVDDQARINAAAKLGDGAIIGDIKADPDYTKAFKAHMRRGDNASAEVRAAMQKGTDTDGGHLAPIEWDRTIGEKLKKISPMRAESRVITISVAGFKKYFSDRNVGSGWVGETASRPATTTPQIGVLDFVPGELYANPAISQQLLDDAAIDLEEWLGQEVDTEFSRQEGIGFPLNIAAGAATVAALAGIGVSVAGSFGGGGKNDLAPTNTGTGTVLGDSSAKSESIRNAIDAAGNHTIIFSIRNLEPDGALTVLAGSTMEITELKRAAV